MTRSTTTTSRRSLHRRQNFAIATRSKAKAKPRKPSVTCSSSSSRTIPILEREWIDMEPGRQFDQAYPVAKKTEYFLRHGELSREEDGAIELWRLKADLRGGNNKMLQYCTDSSGQEILYLRALQGHSGRNSIDPPLQDNVLIPNKFFDYIYHIGCAVNLHFITNSGLIAGGQNSSRDRNGILYSRKSCAQESFFSTKLKEKQLKQLSSQTLCSKEARLPHNLTD